MDIENHQNISIICTEIYVFVSSAYRTIERVHWSHIVSSDEILRKTGRTSIHHSITQIVFAGAIMPCDDLILRVIYQFHPTFSK